MEESTFCGGIQRESTNEAITTYLNENGLLNSGQSGFRSLHSALTALLETNDNWCVNIDRGLDGVIFIDLKKAFDTIDHEYGVDQDALKW